MIDFDWFDDFDWLDIGIAFAIGEEMTDEEKELWKIERDLADDDSENI